MEWIRTVVSPEGGLHQRSAGWPGLEKTSELCNVNQVTDICDGSLWWILPFSHINVAQSADFYPSKFRSTCWGCFGLFLYLQDARHGAALICCALEDAVGSAGATALAKARRQRRQGTMAIPFMATDFQPISSGYYHHKTYQYIFNTIHIKHIKHHAFGISFGSWVSRCLQAQLGPGRPNTGPLGMQSRAGRSGKLWENKQIYAGEMGMQQAATSIRYTIAIWSRHKLFWCPNLVQITPGGQSLERLSHSIQGIF